MLNVYVLDDICPHSSNVAHGVEVPAGARLMFTNGQVGTKADGTTPEATADQAEVVFSRLKLVLEAANMTLGDVARFDVYLTDQADVKTFVEVRDRFLGDHKPGATILVSVGINSIRVLNRGDKQTDFLAYACDGRL